jgi:hypothetical protein
MKHYTAMCVLLIASVASYAQQRDNDATSKEKFVSGGSIRLRLESGGYSIRPTDAENIVVTCYARSQARLSRVKVEIKIAGSIASVYVRNTPDDNFTAVIDVPRRSDLWVRLTAGELNVGSIEGDKDLELRAGQISVAIPRAEDYGTREVSVLSGSIEAPVFDISKGGLFRSFRQHGPGKYRLHAHVMAGEIDLRNSI